MRLVVQSNKAAPETNIIEGLKICPGCSRMFTPYRPFQRYCSDKCRIKIMHGRPSSYTKKQIVARECFECKKVFSTNDDKRHYCSQACYDKHQLNRRVPKESRNCFICGKHFESSHWAKRYCSETCRLAARNK